MVHTVHLFLTERMSSAKRGPLPLFLCLSGVCWKQLHTRHELLKTQRCIFWLFFFEIITGNEIKPGGCRGWRFFGV